MSSFVVQGRKKLSGTVRVVGNKNEALPVIAACLLSRGPVTLRNMPDIGDVRSMLKIAADLGAGVESRENGIVTLRGSVGGSELPLAASREIRASILFASSLLVTTGRAVVPQPGGDAIGLRRIDTHFLVFEALGATLDIEHTKGGDGSPLVRYVLSAPHGLTGADIHLDEASVTATENALIAAAGARGTTTITNAASEPHVQGLCRFLQSLGVEIQGVGSNLLRITGTDFDSRPVEHTISSDYIEAGSFIGLAATTGSELTITNVDVRDLRMILMQYDRLGVAVGADSAARTLVVPSDQHLKIKRDIGGGIPRLHDSPWPGFPADLLSILLVTATQCEGTCLVHEKMFEARLFFTDKLISMGAQIVLCDPHRAVITGPARLYGSTISSPDIRAGMALLIAALCAEGTSTIHNVEQIDRGYQDIEERLNRLGADIVRQTERRKAG